MAKVQAAITTSLDGFITAPGDGPGKGLGERGEILHQWVFGGAWEYGDHTRPEPEPGSEDAAWLESVTRRMGAVVAGRATYEAAGRWGGRNPWQVPLVIVTHRPQEQPPEGGFTFVDGVDRAVDTALRAADGRDVQVMGGGQVIRQALEAGLLDELVIILAPVILGAGKRLFDGFAERLELEPLGVRRSRFATFLEYAVPGGRALRA